MMLSRRVPRRALIHAAVVVPMLAAGARQSRGDIPDGGGRLQTIAPGRDSQTADLGNTQIELRTYKPSNWGGKGILLHFHGLGSHPSGELGSLIHLSDRSGFMLVAPYFDLNRFPFWRYQAVGIAEPGSLRPRESWTGNLILDLLRQLTALEGPGMAVRLIGHSAGGQFVDRFAGFHSAGAARLVAANPASMLMPSRDYSYPYGFGRLPESIASDDAIATYLRQPLVLYVGEVDDQSQGTPDTSPEAMRQGDTRPQRARLAFEAGRALAKARGWEFNWRFVSCPGVGHNLRQMLPVLLRMTSSSTRSLRHAMPAMSQTRRFRDARRMSGLPPTADIWAPVGTSHLGQNRTFVGWLASSGALGLGCRKLMT